MEYKEWNKIYAYGLIFGGIVATLIFLPVFLLGYEDFIPMYGWVLLWGVIVVLFVVLSWFYFRKK
jgi:hypothetical protein